MSARSFLDLYKRVRVRGTLIEIGGKVCRELVDCDLLIPDPADCLTSFEARNLNLNYCKREWLWYLGADRFDDTIQDVASMWKKLKQSDGGFNSNYGQYIFGQDQFDWVVGCLLRDEHSRQACMQLLNTNHMYVGNTDVVCTMGIQFMIRDSRLNMYVHMRSNDLIFGLTNDVFCFAQLQQMVYWALRERGLHLHLGFYKHHVGSMHVYARHFDMLDDIIDQGMKGYGRIEIPRPTCIYDFYPPPDEMDYSLYYNWLLACD